MTDSEIESIKIKIGGIETKPITKEEFTGMRLQTPDDLVLTIMHKCDKCGHESEISVGLSKNLLNQMKLLHQSKRDNSFIPPSRNH